MPERIEQLQQELYTSLKKAESNRRKIQFFRILCYGGALIYFIGFIGIQVFLYSGGDSSFFYTLNSNPTFWEQYRVLIIIIPLFALISIGGYGLTYFQQKYNEAEKHTIRRIIHELFPGVMLNLSPSSLPMVGIIQSSFFSGINQDYASGISFGKITFQQRKNTLIFQDILINVSKSEFWLSKTNLGALLVAIKTAFKGVFSKRIENMTGNFRGLYAESKLGKTINGTVVVLPDNLEKHLDYLAKNIQTLKNVNGNKLVQLEDGDFERYFATYASEEILARYVLTPAMMSRMVELRRKYNRSIMLSFNHDRFYFAVSMPEGFLTLGDGSFTSGKALRDLYDNITTARDILEDLHIK